MRLTYNPIPNIAVLCSSSYENRPKRFCAYKQGGAQGAQNDGVGNWNNSDEDETMASKEETENVNAKSAASRQNEKLYDEEGMLNTRLKRAEKKRRKKANKLAALEDAMEDDEDKDEHDFKVDHQQGSSMNVDGDDVAGISAQIPMAGVHFDDE